jgi:uncharacterized membrane protein
MLHWFRRRFIAGFFVTVPLIISVAALIWIFEVIDGFMGPVYTRLLGREVRGSASSRRRQWCSAWAPSPPT